MAIDIQLTSEQFALAEAEAVRRQQYNEQKRYKGRNRAPAVGEKALQMHLLGCIGEIVVANYLGLQDHLFKNEAPVSGSADLPGNIEVKARSKHGYDLLVQLDDDPNKVFVLVTHQQTTKIVGWILGRHAMRKEWIREFVKGRPCYAVPQNYLKPIEELKVADEQEKSIDRLLEPHEAWLSFDGEDAVLNFSEEVAAMLGWQPGDTLNWEVDEQKQQCYLRKISDRSTSSSNSVGAGSNRTQSTVLSN